MYNHIKCYKKKKQLKTELIRPEKKERPCHEGAHKGHITVELHYKERIITSCPLRVWSIKV